MNHKFFNSLIFDGGNNQSAVFSFGTVVQYLDGTRNGNEFVDKSGNGYNVDIINNDITTQTGFPYKCSALIAQKAANFGRIPDPTNFWFTSGGVPNQIPVTSIFQNVDYAYTTFSKHQSQVLDSNLVEITEPCVLEIVTYSAALSGTNLSNANSYFGVPTESASAKWIDPINGNDTTGTGTKINPYKTIVATEAKSFTAGTQIYIKTGNEAFATRWTASNNYNWKCIGLTKVSGTIGDVVFLNNSNITIEGFYVIATGRTNGIFFKLQNTVSRCYVYDAGTTAIGLNCPNVSSGGTAQYCVFYGLASAISNGMASLTFNFLGNYCASNCTNGYVAGIVTTTITVNFKYNKFYKTGTINGSFTSFNIFNNQLPSSFAVTSGAFTGNLNIKYNTFTPISSGNCIGSSVAHAERYIYDIQNNTFNVSNSYNVQCISLVDQATPIVKYNVMNIQGTTNNSGGIFINAISNDCHPATVSYNTYSNASSVSINPAIQIGNENVGAGDDYLKNSVIEGNKILLSAYFGSSTNTIHSIFITRNTGCSVRYNYISGGSIGVVFKSTNQDNVNAICSYNVIYNCQTPLMAKGITNTKFYNNICLNENNIFSSSFIQIIENTQGATGTVLKNNIIINLDDYNPVLGQKKLIYVDSNSSTGFISNYNDLFSLNNYIGQIGLVYYQTFLSWQSAGYDLNGVNSNVSFYSKPNNLYPNTPIISAENLGSTYNTGLSTITNWPIINTKTQTASWQNGAYIQ